LDFLCPDAALRGALYGSLLLRFGRGIRPIKQRVLIRLKRGTIDPQGRALSVSEKRGKVASALIVHPNTKRRYPRFLVAFSPSRSEVFRRLTAAGGSWAGDGDFFAEKSHSCRSTKYFFSSQKGTRIGRWEISPTK